MHSARHAVPAAGTLTAVAAAAVPAAFSAVSPAVPVVHEQDHAVLAARVVRQLPPGRPLVTRVVSASSGTAYTVAAGDTLSGIAGQSCGNPGKWPGIWHQNQAVVPDPDVIYPGQKLRFTCDGSELAATAPAAARPAPAPTAAASGKTYGVSYGDPNFCGDGDGDGWDVKCPAPARPAPAAAVQAPASASAAVSGVSGGTLSVAGLEALWEAAGGPVPDAPAAASVAECESGGQQYAHNPSGASGYWQILGQVVPGNVYDPLVNAKNAVSKFEASGNTWAQWVCQP